MAKRSTYAKEFKTLDLSAVIKDMHALMTDSQEWWPADFGHYGGLFIRMGGTARAPTASPMAAAAPARASSASRRSTPGRTTRTSTRRAGCCGDQQKYGRKISWADLMSSPGNVALDSMGFKTFGFAGAAPMSGSPKSSTGSEGTWLGDERYSGRMPAAEPLGAVQMGLIYVNPEGPERQSGPGRGRQGHPRNVLRMAMNDEETVALIAGGHTFGRPRRGDPSLIGAEPKAAPLRNQGLGWKSRHGTGNGADAITGGPESPGRKRRRSGSNHFFDNLFKQRMGSDQEPGGAQQWKAKGAAATIPDAFDNRKKHVRRC